MNNSLEKFQTLVKTNETSAGRFQEEEDLVI